MTISATTARTLYAASGTGPYAFPARILTADDLAVTHIDAAGLSTTLTAGGDYRVDDAGEDNCSVTLTHPITDGQLELRLHVALTQETHYTDGDAFPAASHEAALDKLTLIAQQQAEDIGELQGQFDDIPGTVVALVDTAGNIQVDRVNTAGDAQTAAVTQEGSDTVTTVNAAGAAQISAVQVAGQAQVTNIAATPGANEYASAVDALSNGVTGLISVVAGSGGTNGTFALTFTGGAGSGAAGAFTVASGAMVPGSITITAKGRGYTSPPAVSFAASTGITGASATAVIAANQAAATTFRVRTANGADVYIVDVGGTTASYQYTDPSLSAINPGWPLTPDGYLIEAHAADAGGIDRLLVGRRWYDAAEYDSGIGVSGDIVTLAARVTALEGGGANITDPLATNGELVLQLIGPDRRGVTVNLDSGQITPQQGGGLTYDGYLPNDSRLRLSDYWSVYQQDVTTLRFQRGIVDGNGHQYCSPGSRAGFYTDAQRIRFTLYWNALHTRNDAEDSIGGVLVNGALQTTWTTPYGADGTGESVVSIDLGSSALRKVELVWPYGDGVELHKLELSQGAAFAIVSARPSIILAVGGDSIAQGFWASDVFHSWAWLLAVAKNWQLINIANGSASCVPSHASVLGATNAQKVIYAIGYNDFAGQESLTTFQANLQSYLANARAQLPSAQIYVSSMIYTPNTNTITPAQYRTATQAAVTATGDSHVYYVDGLTLMTNNSSRLVDGVHPNDTGAAEIAAAWQLNL